MSKFNVGDEVIRTGTAQSETLLRGMPLGYVTTISRVRGTLHRDGIPRYEGSGFILRECDFELYKPNLENE